MTPCDGCGRRPAIASTGPTWSLCADCYAESDAYDDAHGLARAPRGPLTD